MGNLLKCASKRSSSFGTIDSINVEKRNWFDKTYKIVVIGSNSSGKSSLIERLAKNIFNNAANYTMGVDSATFVTDVDGYEIKINIFDVSHCSRSLGQTNNSKG